MAAVWSDENKFRKFLEIEIAVCEAWNKLGVIPDKALKDIKEKACVDVKRIEEIEIKTKHDVIAFIEQIGSTVGDAGSYLHYGVTSSDILDTALDVILMEAGKILLVDMKKLKDVLKKKSIEYKNIPMIGRTHGIHAEPLTFGFKIAGWYFEMERNVKRMEDAIEEVRVGKISGAVGTYAHLESEIEDYVCKKFNLKAENFSTQIISRDRYAFFISTLGIIAASLEKFALQVRLLQQTELSEASEPFEEGQKGSSAMPHKKNPVLCEKICGLARVIKNNTGVALENVALWHERDISHSSAERIIFPESTILLDYILDLSVNIFENLNVEPEKMKADIFLTRGLVFSQKVLLELCRKGLPRKDAYSIVQRNALKCYDGEKDFKKLLLEDNDVRKYLSEEEIEKTFDVQWYLRHIDKIFKKLK